MESMAISCNEHEVNDLPEGLYWITGLAVFYGKDRVDSGAHRYWGGIVETNGLSKELLISRLREKRSVFSRATTVMIRGYCHISA